MGQLEEVLYLQQALSALRQPERSAGLRAGNARPPANTLLAALTAAPAAETRHGPHQARGRGPELRDGVEFGYSLDKCPVPVLCVPLRGSQAQRAPGTARWPPVGRGSAPELTPVRLSFQPPAAPPSQVTTPSPASPGGAGLRAPPPPCDSAARRAPTWSGPGRDGQAASRAGAAAQPEQEAEEAPAGVRRGAPVL